MEKILISHLQIETQLFIQTLRKCLKLLGLKQPHCCTFLVFVMFYTLLMVMYVPLCRLLSEGKPPPPSRHCSHCGHSHWSRSAGHNPIISDWLYSGRPTKRSTKNLLSSCAFLMIHVVPFNVRDLTVLEVEQQGSFSIVIAAGH